MADPTREQIEAALEWHREAADLGPHTVAPEEAVLARAAERYLSILRGEGPTVTVWRTDKGGVGVLWGDDKPPPPPGIYVLVKKEDT